jgi:hypothetical protein
MKNKFILVSACIFSLMVGTSARADLVWPKCPSASLFSVATVNGLPTAVDDQFWFADAGMMTLGKQNWYVGAFTMEETQAAAGKKISAALTSVTNSSREFYVAPNDFYCMYNSTINDHTMIIAATAPILALLSA